MLLTQYMKVNILGDILQSIALHQIAWSSNMNPPLNI